MADTLAEAYVKMSATGQAEVQRAIGGINRGLSQLAAMGSGLGALFTTGALAIGLKSCINAFMEAESNGAKLEAVLQATGFAAGMTAQEMQDLAGRLQNVSRFEDDAIIKAQTILATFRNVEGGIFKQATVAAMDLSTILGGDLSASAMQLGKALSSPVEGINALRRAGINFSSDQRKVIADFVKTGEVAKAQKVILAEINAQVGGSAAADAKTTAGAIDQIKNAWGELQEIVGRSLGTWLKPTLEYWTDKLREIRKLLPDQDTAGGTVRAANTRNKSPADQLKEIEVRRRMLNAQEQAELKKRNEAKANIDQFQWLSDITGRPNQPTEQLKLADAEGKLLEIGIAKERLNDQEVVAKARKQTEDGNKALEKLVHGMRDQLVPELKAAALGAKLFAQSVENAVQKEKERQQDKRDEEALTIADRVDRAKAFIDEMKGGRVDNVDVDEPKMVSQRVGVLEFANVLQDVLSDNRRQKKLEEIAKQQRDATINIDKANTDNIIPLLKKIADKDGGMLA